MITSHRNNASSTKDYPLDDVMNTWSNNKSIVSLRHLVTSSNNLPTEIQQDDSKLVSHNFLHENVVTNQRDTNILPSKLSRYYSNQSKEQDILQKSNNVYYNNLPQTKSAIFTYIPFLDFLLPYNNDKLNQHDFISRVEVDEKFEIEEEKSEFEDIDCMKIVEVKNDQELETLLRNNNNGGFMKNMNTNSRNKISEEIRLFVAGEDLCTTRLHKLSISFAKEKDSPRITNTLPFGNDDMISKLVQVKHTRKDNQIISSPVLNNNNKTNESVCLPTTQNDNDNYSTIFQFGKCNNIKDYKLRIDSDWAYRSGKNNAGYGSDSFIGANNNSQDMTISPDCSVEIKPTQHFKHDVKILSSKNRGLNPSSVKKVRI